jgi:1-aminocyclopropane-1-carboxylate deaminase/D-cysteine desulfhydrase-like pyridoxal-dependent ACC family enzyme
LHHTKKVWSIYPTCPIQSKSLEEGNGKEEIFLNKKDLLLNTEGNKTRKNRIEIKNTKQKISPILLLSPGEGKNAREARTRVLPTES